MWGGGGGGLVMENSREWHTGMYWYEWHVWKREENKGGLKDEYNKEGLKIKYRGLNGIFKVFVFG